MRYLKQDIMVLERNSNYVMCTRKEEELSGNGWRRIGHDAEKKRKKEKKKLVVEWVILVL